MAPDRAAWRRTFSAASGSSGSTWYCKSRLVVSGTPTMLSAWPADGFSSHGGDLGGYSNPMRLRPPRWTSQRVNATEATTAVMSRMSVVIAVIYLTGSHSNCANSTLI
jgi:hypothetical protein